jgi:hypothetical protein
MNQDIKTMNQDIWLDRFFRDPDTAKDSMLADQRVLNAFEAAKKAFKEQEAKSRPEQIGLPPHQAARQAFLSALDLQPSPP